MLFFMIMLNLNFKTRVIFTHVKAKDIRDCFDECLLFFH